MRMTLAAMLLLAFCPPCQAQTLADVMAAVKALDEKVTFSLKAADARMTDLEARIAALEKAGAGGGGTTINHYYGSVTTGARAATPAKPVPTPAPPRKAGALSRSTPTYAGTTRTPAAPTGALRRQDIQRIIAEEFRRARQAPAATRPVSLGVPARFARPQAVAPSC